MQKNIMDKKGFAVLGKIPIAVLYLVLIGILLVIGLRIMAGVRDEMTVNSSEYNASLEAMEGLETVSSYQSLLGLIVVMISIVLLLLGGFAFFFVGGRGAGR